LGDPCSVTPVRVVLDNGCVPNNVDQPAFVFDLGNDNTSEEIVGTPHIGQRYLLIYPAANRVILDMVAYTRDFGTFFVLWSDKKAPMIPIARI
jgi:hypothetical protein